MKTVIVNGIINSSANKKPCFKICFENKEMAQEYKDKIIYFLRSRHLKVDVKQAYYDKNTRS